MTEREEKLCTALNKFCTDIGFRIDLEAPSHKRAWLEFRKAVFPLLKVTR